MPGRLTQQQLMLLVSACPDAARRALLEVQPLLRDLLVQEQAAASSSDSDGDDGGACGSGVQLAACASGVQLPACAAAGAGDSPCVAPAGNGMRLHVTADPGGSGWRRLLVVLDETPRASREQQAAEAVQLLAAAAGAAPVTLTCWHVADRAAGPAGDGSPCWQGVLVHELESWRSAGAAALQLVPVECLACWAPVPDGSGGTASWAVLQALVVQA